MGFCCDEEIPPLGSTIQSKAGYVLKYKDGWFSSGWEEVWLVLYSDSVLLWYEGQNNVREGPKGGVRLADSPDLIAAGQHTARVPDRPPLPPGVNINQMIAVGKRPNNKVNWFATRSEKEAEEWLSGIISTLPPPPQYQQQAGPKPSYPQQQQFRGPPPGGQFRGHPQFRGPPPGGQFRSQPQFRGPMGGQFHGNYHGGRRDSGPGFGTGLLAGGLLGWGMGGGWGMGMGGWGWGGHHGGGFFNNESVTNTTNEVNNMEVNNFYGDDWGSGGGELPGMTGDGGNMFGGGGEDMDFDIGDFGDF